MNLSSKINFCVRFSLLVHMKKYEVILFRVPQTRGGARFSSKKFDLMTNKFPGFLLGQVATRVYTKYLFYSTTSLQYRFVNYFYNI